MKPVRTEQELPEALEALNRHPELFAEERPEDRFQGA
jgi:hypothetical protein